ncbi:Ig-like domain-containing protein [Flavitalea sp. BT771]|uniref:Ig-like domain-containing protein n=1 Tax=Flavitalea sp. BT771 TaxID=3063329 RepID=UPI0026E1B6E1|nr:Ig-like domain-containing protein [Flavitalea sp. BT771]MDO6430493.1 Ig-like domain-containing protein [Flavitalea sp. BT771]MDV6219367.1 Ig-like domain-containing protein [Flavitalea sp. BT771]
MKPTILTLLNVFSNSGRRRKLLSALVIGLAFIAGLPVNGEATPVGPHSGADNMTITITKDYSIINDMPDIITVHIEPIPSPPEDITFNISKFGYTPVITTDVNGNAVLSFKGTIVGPVDVEVIRNGVTVATVQVHFIAAPGPIDLAKSYLTVVHSPETASGTNQDIVMAHLIDIYGNLAYSTPVDFEIVSGTASFVAGPSLTTGAKGSANPGEATATLVSTVVGDVVIKAKTPDGYIGNTVTVQFIADVPDPSQSYIEVIQNPAAADGASEDIVRAHILDQYGHLLNVPVTFSILSGTATFSSPSSGSSTGGTIDAKLVSNTVGNVKVGATVKINGVDVFIKGSGGGTDVTVNFIAGPPDVTNPQTMLVVDKGIAAADGVDANNVHAHLVDKAGNLINYPVDISFFIIPSGSADATAVLIGSATGVTPVNGDLPLTITDPTAGTVQIGAKVTYTYKGVTTTVIITNGSPASVKFVDPSIPDPSNPANMLVVDKATATADGVDFTQIHAHLVNAAGGALKNVSVTIDFFIIPSGGPEATAVLSLIGSQTVTTSPTGDVILTIKNTKVGTVKLGAKFNGVAITTGSPAPVTFVSGVAVPSAPNAPSGTGTMLTITKDFAPANGVATDIVNAHITDALGNPVPNTVVTFSIRAGGTSTATAALVGSVTVTTDASGNAIMKITNTVAGTVWIDATIDYNGNPTALIDGSYKEVTFTNFPDVTNSATRLIVIVYEALADGTSTTVVKAHIVDQHGDPLPGWDVAFKVDSGAAQIITPGPWTTDANGDVSIELTSGKPGFALITATVNDQAITFGSPARVKFAAINIYVPPVFTPNGDGNNDVLKPILVGISAFHYFNVYNRWGNLIFTTQDPNNGWDGRFKGVPQPVETYLWIAEGVDLNGKKIVAKGMTSLVK